MNHQPKVEVEGTDMADVHMHSMNHRLEVERMDRGRIMLWGRI
jgi:hypothetical protein